MKSFSLGKLSVGAGGLAFGSLLLFQGVPYLFDWDELIYASLARHMVSSGNWLELMINQAPFWEKPPLFFWLQSGAMSLLGVSEWAARIPNALIGGVLVAMLVWIGASLRGIRFGCLWGILLSTSLLPLLFAKTGLIDPSFNLLMLVGLGGLYLSDQARLAGKSGSVPVVVGALALGLAVLAKGPLGLGMPLIIWGAYKVWHRRPYPSWQAGGAILVLGCGVPLAWFGLEWAIQGPTFILEFVRYQWRILTHSDGHPGPVYFHLLAYGVGCFPFAALTGLGWWRAMKDPTRSEALKSFDHLLTVAFGVVLALFSLVVQTKLVHYTSLLYPLGSYFAAVRLQDLLSGQRLTRLESVGIVGSGGLWVVFLGLLPWLGTHRQWVGQWVTDPLTQAYLSAPVDWAWFTYLPSGIMGLGLGVWLVVKLPASRRWAVLLLSTWLSGELAWGVLAPRLLDHTQGGSVGFFRQFQAAGSPAVALHGFRSFVPFFYGSEDVPSTQALWQLIPLVENQAVHFVVTWQPWQAALTERLPLQPVATSGAFVLLGAIPETTR